MPTSSNICHQQEHVRVGFLRHLLKIEEHLGITGCAPRYRCNKIARTRQVEALNMTILDYLMSEVEAFTNLDAYCNNLKNSNSWGGPSWRACLPPHTSVPSRTPI